jgi:hypothetical protein
MITAIYIGTKRLDLFEDENIVIKSNVSKITDITKVFTDTSNTFTVPATDVNNGIFKHWYNANIINGFDARKKVPAVIELSGINFKVGKIKLNNVGVKNGKPDNYSLDYFGNLVELKDLVGNDLLNTLDLSALNFTYSSTAVRTKLQTVSDLCFSLLSKRRLLYDSVNTIADNDTQTNIYFDGSNTTTGIKVSDITASLKQLKIIEAIEADYNLTFSREFLGGYDFNNQYLALTGLLLNDVFDVPFENASEPDPDPTVAFDVMLATGVGTASERETTYITLIIDDFNSSNPYNLFILSNNNIIARKENITGGGSVTFTNVDNLDLENITFQVQSIYSANITGFVKRKRTNANLYEYFFSNILATFNFLVSNRLPNIKVIDYLSGLFKMFKLVAIAKKDGSIFIDSITNYYRDGRVYDLTQYIDISSYQIDKGELLNRINYQFEDPQTILNQQFKKNNNVGFGDLELDIVDENGLAIDGSSLDFKVPFEQIVYEKIQDISNNILDTNIQYGLLLNEELKTVDIKPHIHYIENRTTSIKFLNDIETLASNLLSANIPLHVLTLNSQLYSTTFGSEFNTFNGVEITNTLYSNYHSDFIQRVFSQNKRQINLKARDLPTSVVLQLGLNDVILFKDNYYRIESFDVNTSNNDVDFKLINDRNVNLTNSILLTVDNGVITSDNNVITADEINEPIIDNSVAIALSLNSTDRTVAFFDYTLTPDENMQSIDYYLDDTFVRTSTFGATRIAVYVDLTPNTTYNVYLIFKQSEGQEYRSNTVTFTTNA